MDHEQNTACQLLRRATSFNCPIADRLVLHGKSWTASIPSFRLYPDRRKSGEPILPSPEELVLLICFCRYGVRKEGIIAA